MVAQRIYAGVCMAKVFQATIFGVQSMAKKSKTSQQEPQEEMKPSAIKYSELSSREALSLLYEIAKLRIDERDEHNKVLSYKQIAKRIKDWARDNISKEAYNEKGTVQPNWVGRHMAKAIGHRFVRLGRYVEREIVESVKKCLNPPYPKIVVAPSEKELLRYVWEDLDGLVAEAAEKNVPQVVIAVSGGRTLLSLARAADYLPHAALSRLSTKNRKKIIVCSLTSGGLPSDIAALSDTVAGTINASLDVNARGLLGPTWFDGGGKALTAFTSQKHVKEHEDLVEQADFVITSIGLVQDKDSLMGRLCRDRKQNSFLKEHANLADILYNCYDGHTGKTITPPPIIETGLYSYVGISKLKKMVQKEKACIIVAKGREKGYHALPGVFKAHMANYIYMDRDCAGGLIDALQEAAGTPATGRTPGR